MVQNSAKLGAGEMILIYSFRRRGQLYFIHARRHMPELATRRIFQLHYYGSAFPKSLSRLPHVRDGYRRPLEFTRAVGRRATSSAVSPACASWQEESPRRLVYRVAAVSEMRERFATASRKDFSMPFREKDKHYYHSIGFAMMLAATIPT